MYLATQIGSFAAVCPNGVPRFVIPVPPTSSTAVVVQDPNQTQVTPIIAVGGINGQVRAYNLTGSQYWSFFASATINAALMVDLSDTPQEENEPDLLYVADSGGLLFKVTLMNGQPVDGFAPPPFGKLSASPALGREEQGTIPKLYVADETGILYALKQSDGTICWRFDAGGQITASPAVATGGEHDVIIGAADVLGVLNEGEDPVVVGGKVFAVGDDDNCDGTERTAMWTVIPGKTEGQLGYSIGASSPSIAPNGTVYIGRTGTRLGTEDECPGDGPCVVNKGGALYAIDP